MTVTSNFFNPSFAGEQLHSVLTNIGEDVFFIDKTTQEKIYCKLSMDDLLRPSQSAAERTFHFIGEMTFPNRESIRDFCGQYFYKVREPEKTYMLITAVSNPFSEYFANVDVVECNETIDIGYIKKEQDPTTSKIKETWEEYISNVKVFATTVFTKPSDTDGGSLTTSTTSIYMPSFCLVTPDNYIQRNVIGRGENGVNVLTKQMFYIREVSISLATEADDGEINGAILVTVNKKI